MWRQRGIGPFVDLSRNLEHRLSVNQFLEQIFRMLGKFKDVVHW